jgi:hypothetical protein
MKIILLALLISLNAFAVIGPFNGITSINSDTTAAQVISGSGAINVSTVLGTTALSCTAADATHNGCISSTNYSAWQGAATGVSAIDAINGVIACDGAGNFSSFSAVPTSRTVNGHALSGNVTITASDVGLGSASNYTAMHSVGATVTASNFASFSGTTGASVTDSGYSASSFLTSFSGLVESFTGHIVAPAAYTYVLDQYAAFAYTINSYSAQTSAGTITCAIKIGSTAVTGLSAVSVSATPSTTNGTAANSVSVGNQVIMVCSSPSSAADLSFTLKITR